MIFTDDKAIIDLQSDSEMALNLSKLHIIYCKSDTNNKRRIKINDSKFINCIFVHSHPDLETAHTTA